MLEKRIKKVGCFLKTLNRTSPKILYDFIFWLLWDFSGLRSIIYKIRPPKNQSTGIRNPATFMLWFIGIYVALFGIAFQQYQKSVDLIENRAASIFDQLGTEYYKTAIGRIPMIQRMTCPVEPEIFNPQTIILFLFGKKINNLNVINQSKEMVTVCKDSLNSMYLRNADLHKIDLSFASIKNSQFIEVNLDSTSFMGSNLEGSQFFKVDLSNCDFNGAKCSNARFINCNLSESNFWTADLRYCLFIGSDLRLVDFYGSSLVGADLSGTYNLESEQISETLSLYNAKMDSSHVIYIKNNYPKLLEVPSQEVPNITFVGGIRSKPIK